MDETTAEQLRRQLMWDHDANPHILTETLDELRTLQELSGSSEELVERYRKVSSKLLDFMSRLHDLAVADADGCGGSVSFSDSTLSQILLDCVRGYPDFVRLYDGLNVLLNTEMENRTILEQQVYATAQHYEKIIERLTIEE